MHRKWSCNRCCRKGVFLCEFSKVQKHLTSRKAAQGSTLVYAGVVVQRSILEAQRRGRGPPRHVDDADGDGGDDDGDFPFMSQVSPTAEDCFWAPDSDFPSRRPRKRASIPELLVSEKSGGSEVSKQVCPGFRPNKTPLFCNICCRSICGAPGSSCCLTQPNRTTSQAHGCSPPPHRQRSRAPTHHGRLSLSSRVEPITSAACPFHNSHLLEPTLPLLPTTATARMPPSASRLVLTALPLPSRVSIRYRIKPSGPVYASPPQARPSLQRPPTCMCTALLTYLRRQANITTLDAPCGAPPLPLLPRTVLNTDDHGREACPGQAASCQHAGARGYRIVQHAQALHLKPATPRPPPRTAPGHL